MAKTLKIKKAEPTIAAKPVVTASPEGGADGAPAGEAAPAQPSGGIYVSSRHKMENAGIGPGAAVERAPRFGWAAALAIVSTVLFLVIVILEFADWEALKFA